MKTTLPLILISLSMALFIGFGAFKILHWPGVNILRIGALSTFVLGAAWYGVVLLLQKQQEEKQDEENDDFLQD